MTYHVTQRGVNTLFWEMNTKVIANDHLDVRVPKSRIVVKVRLQIAIAR